MQTLPNYIAILFVLSTLLTIVLFYIASRKSSITLIVLLIWLGLQGFIGSTGFYIVENTMPPRFILLVLPALILIVILFSTSSGRKYIDQFSLRTLTLIHIVRIPVEIVLFWLFTYNVVPKLMTFEGRNFDILSGISAPLIFYFGFMNKSLNKKIILLWNIVCLGLLLNIVINAVLSAPFQFQQFAFEQPNIAVLYFPFNWLPSVVVPIVLFSHLITIRQLTNKSFSSVSQ